MQGIGLTVGEFCTLIIVVLTLGILLGWMLGRLTSTRRDDPVREIRNVRSGRAGE